MNDSELRIATALSGNKGFPCVYGDGKHEDSPYIIMQLLGLNLFDLIKRNKKYFCTKTAVSIGISLISLVETMHGKGFIHCDIKPDNIMIGDYKNQQEEMN